MDRDPTYFRYVLNWLRGVKYLPDEETVLNELIWEADYFCLEEMRDAIIRTKNRYNMSRSLHNIHLELRQSHE